MVNTDKIKILYDFKTDSEQGVQSVLKEYEALKEKLGIATDYHCFRPEFTFPSENDFYKFAALAYNRRAEVLASQKDGFLDGDWHLLKMFEGSTGARAMLFLNAAARQLMLTFKGTSPTWLLDLHADFLLSLNANSAHFDSACTIANEVRNTIEDLNGRVQLFITGHSLGGFMAQIATYTIKHRRIEENKFVQLAPSDIEIHAKTVVFDSPPCLDQIIATSEFNPIDPSHFHLDITTYVFNKNVINNLGPRRPHLGTVLWCKPSEPEENAIWGVLLKHLNPFQGHTLVHFSDIGRTDSDLVENIGDWRVRRYDASVIPLATFSLQELECLKVMQFVEFLENKSFDMKFIINELNVKLLGVKADTFVPKARILIREERARFEGVPAKVFEFFYEAMQTMLKILDFEFHSIDMELEAKFIEKIESTQGDISIRLSGFNLREKILLAKIIQNSIANFYFMDYKKFAIMELKIQNSLLANFSGTLALLVEDGEFYHMGLEKKCRFLIISSKNVERLTQVFALNSLCFSHISEEGRLKALDFTVSFFGEYVALKNLGVDAQSKMPLLQVLDFYVDDDEEVKSDFSLDFYVPQDVSPDVKQQVPRLKMDEFITNELILDNETPRRILLCATAGMGKSTYLRELRENLQRKLAVNGFWVTKIYFPDCSEFFSELDLKMKRNSHFKKRNLAQKMVTFDPKEFICKHALPKNCSEFEKKVLIDLLERKKVFLLLDAFDEVCPEYRELSARLLTELKMGNFNFIVSTRPHEADSLKINESSLITKTFRLLEFDEAAQEQFFIAFFNRKMNSEEAQNTAKKLQSSLKNTEVATNFWGVPLHAFLVAKIFEDNLFSVESFDNLASLYSAFLDVRLSKDLEEKLGLSKAKAKSRFFETKEEVRKCLTIAATQQILGIRVLGTKHIQRRLKKMKDDINATGIASVNAEGKILRVTFSSSHISFAEYLAATYLVDQVKEHKLISMLSEFISEPQFLLTRRFFNDLLRRDINLDDISVSPINMHMSSIITHHNRGKERPHFVGCHGDQFVANEDMKRELQALEPKILRNLASENLSKLYKMLKSLIDFKWNAESFRFIDIGPSSSGAGLSFYDEDLLFEPILEVPENYPLLSALENADEDFVMQLLEDSEIAVSLLPDEYYFKALDISAKRNFLKLTKLIDANGPWGCSPIVKAEHLEALIEDVTKSPKRNEELILFLQSRADFHRKRGASLIS